MVSSALLCTIPVHSPVLSTRYTHSPDAVAMFGVVLTHPETSQSPPKHSLRPCVVGCRRMVRLTNRSSIGIKETLF